MGTVILILKIGLILFSIVAWISYSSKKADTRRALRNLDTETPERKLTTGEHDLLASFLQEKKLSLISSDVYRIAGDYYTHGIESNNQKTMHDVISGIEVVFPYDLKNYLDVINEALVVRAQKQAVVIWINGYELSGSAQRETIRAQQNADWVAGKVGAITPAAQLQSESQNDISQTITSEALTDIPLAPEQLQNQDTSTATEQASEFEVKIISQRDETPEETENRLGRGMNALSVMLWIIAACILWFAAENDRSSIAISGTAIVIAIIGAILFLRRASPQKAVKVNRVRGPLTITLGKPFPTAELSVPLPHLGHQIPLMIPKYWNKVLDTQIGETIEAQVRVGDNSVVGLGLEWSITEEMRRFRPYYWGRYLLAALVGMSALALHSCITESSSNDYHLSYAYYLGEHHTYSQMQQILENPPAVNTYIHIQGNARCELTSGNEAELFLPVSNCQYARWGGNISVKVPELSIPSDLLALYSGSFITTTEKRERNPSYGMYGYGGYGYFSPYTDVMSVTRFNNSLKIVEAACDAGLSTCEDLKSSILQIISTHVLDRKVQRWQSLVQMAKPGKPLHEFEISSNSVTNQLRNAAQYAVVPYIIEQLGNFSEQVIESQTGGILIGTVSHHTNSPPVAIENLPDTSWIRNNINRYLTELANFATHGSETSFEFEGLLSQVELNAQGTPVLSINLDYNSHEASKALARTLLLLLGLMLTIICGVLAFIRCMQAQKRQEKLQEYCNQLPLPTLDLFT